MQLIERFTTCSASPAENLSVWNEISRTLFGPTTVKPLNPREFTASVSWLKLRELDFVVPVSAAARVARTCTTLGPPTFSLQVQHTGKSWFRTCGEEHVLEPGDCALFDRTQPFEMQFEETTRVIALWLPGNVANNRIPGLGKLVGAHLSGRTPTGSLLSSFVSNTWHQMELGSIDGWVDSVSDVIWPLIEMAYSGHYPLERPRSRREALRKRAMEFIDLRLADPGLGVAAIADELGTSARYVQMLFAEISKTPSSFIQAKRLDWAARLLDKKGASVSITEVAFSVGFEDLSAFSRLFRQRFAVTPRQYRAGMRPPRQ